ncbi:hypothetical protein DM01DRAFT_117105 [Hesseltinella vesiculosa]|uniref:Uncharacterized protein n=1 Tax=Hesseltinella vesiculosa TaxID=101127 RepID=A0A1X2GXS6_9FUNG|nr:hypothetical protein DM01DRAFT_117105 [Hesseltinella vesiculosa]
MQGPSLYLLYHDCLWMTLSFGSFVPWGQDPGERNLFVAVDEDAVFMYKFPTGDGLERRCASRDDPVLDVLSSRQSHSYAPNSDLPLLMFWLSFILAEDFFQVLSRIQLPKTILIKPGHNGAAFFFFWRS